MKLIKEVLSDKIEHVPRVANFIPQEGMQNRNRDRIVASLVSRIQTAIVEVLRHVHRERAQQHMMTRRQVPASRVRSSDEVADIPEVMQRQVPTFRPIQKRVEVPQIQYIDKIVDALVAVTQQSVPVEAETLSQDRPIEWVDDASRASTSTCIVPRETGVLVQRGESVQVVDETGVQGPECGGQGPLHELVQVAPNMVAGGTHPQATLKQESVEELRESGRADRED